MEYNVITTKEKIQTIYHKMIDNLKSGSAGAIGGTVCAVSGHPLDTIKVNIQVSPEKFKGPLNCAAYIQKTQGFRGFFKGLGPALSCQVLENFVLFLFYPKCCQIADNLVNGINRIDFVNNLGVNQDYRGVVSKILGGTFASFFAAFVISPTELIKCRLQALQSLRDGSNAVSGTIANKKINGFVLIADILRTDGIQGMFKGQVSTILREVFGYSLIFVGYESTNHLLRDANLGANLYALSGAVGGMFYWTVIYPMDVVKTRIQVLSLNKTSNFNPTIWSISREIIRNRGLRAFYTGFSPTIIRAAISNALLFYTYNLVKNYVQTS